jgi:hypothetical protein
VMTRVDESVMVWVSDDGVPQRIVWRTQRFRVSDEPTRLSATFPGWQIDEVFDPAITHPPEQRESWRFQATSERGETHVFDVSREPYNARWRLLRTYD